MSESLTDRTEPFLIWSRAALAVPFTFSSMTIAGILGLYGMQRILCQMGAP